MPWQRRRAVQTPLRAPPPRAALRRPAPLLLAALFLAPALPAPGTLVEARWDWTLGVPDPASGLVHVALRLSGMGGAVTRFTFQTEGAREAVTNVTAGPSTQLVQVPEGFAVLVDGDESLAYDVRVDGASFRAGERLASVTPSFALLKAESVALPYAYEYREGFAFHNRSTVRLAPPPGWSAAGPWPQREDGAFDLADGAVVPRGFVAFGPFHAWENHTLAGKRIQYVRLGAAAPFERDLPAFVERATPYFEAVYGPAGRDLLVVSAPDPMLRGGLGGMDSLYVHESADLATLAHEYAHVHQRFGPDETAGRSSVWLAEGDADWHGALAMHAAGFWTATRVDEAFREAERDRAEPAFAQARLPDATYGAQTSDGHSLERYAYHKGAVVLRALDARLRQATQGGAGAGEVLRRLNDAHGDPTRDALLVDNAEVAALAFSVAGEDLSEFFAQFVNGTAWPDAPRFQPAGELALGALILQPPAAQPGARVNATLAVANEGTRRLDRDLVLLVDGAPAQTFTLSLAVGERRNLTANVTAGAPGDHEVRALHRAATLRALSPPRLTLGNVTLLPATPRAGEPFTALVIVENHGETAGHARVRVGNATREVDVPALGATGVTLPALVNETGNRTLDITLISEFGNGTRVVQFAVSPPGRKESPGVPLGIALIGIFFAARVGRRR